MPKRKLLNVRSHLEHTNSVIVMMLEEHARHATLGGVNLPPLFETELRKLRFIGDMILLKHSIPGTRKDIRIEAPDGD